MGFFSWKTSDTGESIANRYTGKCRAVYLVLPEKNVLERAYDGYGVFGGIDVYDLLAERNGLANRDEAINLQFSDRYAQAKFQLKFSFDKNARYDDLPAAENCEYQGYFYNF